MSESKRERERERERNGSIINRSLHIIAHASLFIIHLRQDHHSLLTMGCPRTHSTATTTLCLMYVVISSDGQFALSGSWDNTLQIWDLST